MLHKERLERPEFIYPVEEWRLVECRYFPEALGQNETFFATANGYLGLRGSFEEGFPVHDAGTYLNGFYESWPIVYGEDAFGFAKTGQTILSAPDAKRINLYVDDELFRLDRARLLRYERALNMKEGTLDRDVLWETPIGKKVRVRSRRLVSFHRKHSAVIFYEVTLPEDSGNVVLSSKLIVPQRKKDGEEDDPRRSRGFDGGVLQLEHEVIRDHRIILGYRTRNSGMTLAAGVDHRLETRSRVSVTAKPMAGGHKVVYTVQAEPGVPIRLAKFITYHRSNTVSSTDLCDRAERSLERSLASGFSGMLSDQKAYMDDFWARSDIETLGDPAVQQALRFNLFQILQATGRSEGNGVPAKGLTGQGYEGHYFWDTEVYVLPFLIYTAPRVARNLLLFRHSYLDKARERARQVNQKGALFPWRTINGEEASAYYAAGTAQYHINADIVHALKKYVDVTGDETALEEFGAEILVETARLWVDLGFFSERRGGKFCICGVTGPDEYNTVVNNNVFTNLMARENLRYAAEVVHRFEKEKPEVYRELVFRTGLEPTEPDAWQLAAENMYLPYDEELGIHLQDDEFLYKKPWDFENTPPEKYPLLLHYHPLVIYRHQVIKQADVILAMFLLGDEFTAEEKRRNFDFYDPLTTGDSSLSVSIQAIMAFELGQVEKAGEYLRYSALMDLADVAGNAADGCHIASMGGTWMGVVYGVAGMRDYDGRLSFNPRPPARVEGYRIPLTFRGRRLQITITCEKVRYLLVRGEPLSIRHVDEEIRLAEGRTVERNLSSGGTRPADPEGNG